MYNGTLSGSFRVAPVRKPLPATAPTRGSVSSDGSGRPERRCERGDNNGDHISCNRPAVWGVRAGVH